MRILSQTFNNATMKSFESTGTKITMGTSGETLPQLEITEVRLSHCNIFNSTHQCSFRVLHTSALLKSNGQRFAHSQLDI